MSYLPAVDGVALIDDYRLRLLFDDGTARDVDFHDGLLHDVLHALVEGEGRTHELREIASSRQVDAVLEVALRAAWCACRSKRQGVGLALRGVRTQREGELPAGRPGLLPWVDAARVGRDLIIGQIRAHAIGRERAGTTRVDADRCVPGVGIAAGHDGATVALDRG